MNTKLKKELFWLTIAFAIVMLLFLVIWLIAPVDFYGGALLSAVV